MCSALLKREFPSPLRPPSVSISTGGESMEATMASTSPSTSALRCCSSSSSVSSCRIRLPTRPELPNHTPHSPLLRARYSHHAFPVTASFPDGRRRRTTTPSCRIRPDPPDWIRTTSKTNTPPGSGTATTQGEARLDAGAGGGDDVLWPSMSKALSSTVWMIRELRGHAVASRLGPGGDPDGVLPRVRGEIDESFCWLFERVFARTPDLLLSLVLLLADFVGTSLEEGSDGGCEMVMSGVCSASGKGRSDRSVSGGVGFHYGTAEEEPEIVVELEKEARLWRMMMEEANRMKAETRPEALMDRETLLGLVAPVTVEAEPDRDYPEFLRMDLTYRSAIDADPENPMLLSNYAQFLFQVARDLPRAEHYFERAAGVKPCDAEALGRYAQFLWLGKQELGKAEEMYLEAIEADPCNVAHHSNYAHFLWMTGAEDTCYPLDEQESS